MDMDRLQLWAQAIDVGVTTKFQPPDNPEFNTLKEQHKLRKGKEKKKSESPPPSCARTQFVLIPSSHSRYPETPRRSQSVVEEISPVKAFEPHEYNTKALYTYLKFLGDRYSDPVFLEAYSPLCEAKIGVDIIKSHLQNPDLRKELHEMLKGAWQGIQMGTISRITRDYPKWEASFGA
jgi:hypothetical protein